MKLSNPTITSFDATVDTPARVTVGGQDAHGKRADTYSFPTGEFLDAAKGLLKPSLDAVLEEAAGILRRQLAACDTAKSAYIAAHKAAERELRRLFAMKTGQLVNEQLERTVNTAHGEVTVVTPSIGPQ